MTHSSKPKLRPVSRSLNALRIVLLRVRFTDCSVLSYCPTVCWQETPAQYTTRIKKVVEDINANLDVAGLCNGLPKRLQDLADAEGGRLKH